MALFHWRSSLGIGQKQQKPYSTKLALFHIPKDGNPFRILNFQKCTS